MRILIYGSTYITELCVNQLLKDGYNLVGYIPSEKPTFQGKFNLPIVDEKIPHDIKLSIQYDKKLITVEDAFNLHTGLLPQYGGCSILYNTIKNKDYEQGLTLHKMTESFDEGSIIAKMTYPVEENDSVADLYIKLCMVAPQFLSNALKMISYRGKTIKPKLYMRKDVPEEQSIKDTEEIKSRLHTKACKIIACTVVDGRDCRNNVSFPAHNQIVETRADVIKMMQDLVEFEKEQDAGMPVDVYLVNNNTGDTEVNEWFDSLNGTKLKNGNLYVIHRKNTGGSFGAYNDAYLALRNKYEWFLFTEDDLFIGGDEYYLKAVKKFKDLGFLAFIDVGERDEQTHCHGGVGLSHRKILNEVMIIPRKLPCPEGYFDKQQAIREGEIPFTNKIYQMGYKLKRMGEFEGWSIKNYCLPYYNYVHKS